jgi:hypothetical protein
VAAHSVASLLGVDLIADVLAEGAEVADVVGHPVLLPTAL